MRASELVQSSGFPAAVSWFGKSSVEETRRQFGNLCSRSRVRPTPRCTSSQDPGKHRSSFSLNGKTQPCAPESTPETWCSWQGFMQPTCGYFPGGHRDVIAMRPCYQICLRLDINLFINKD